MIQTRTEKKAKGNGPFGKALRLHSGREKLVAIVLSVTVPMATMPPVALALPHGGVVTRGHATLSYSTNTLLIRQSTSSASFSWTGFNVGSGQSVSYRTPGSSSVSLNFIGGTSPAAILGKVSSNGILTFMDANGIVFGSGSTVSAAGIRAYGQASTTASLTGSVTNAGTLTAGPGGQVVLVGTDVTNSGTIDAPSGQVILAAGSAVTVSESPSSSLSVVSTGGGNVLDSGVIRAENADGTPGQVVLEAGMGSGTTTLTQSAVLDASAPNGGNGGNVTLNGSGVILNNVTPVDVSSAQGTPGTVTIDPNYSISGSIFDACDAAGLEYLDANQSSYLADTVNLMASVNLATGSNPYAWTPLGNGSSSASYFTGTFNGNGHTVSGYTITATANDAGFIGGLGSGGIVENLGVAGTVTGGSFDNIGGVVGENSGTVESSWNTGSVGGGTGFNIGGVVGRNFYGTVETSYNTGNIGASGSGSFNVGGVVGDNLHGTVEDSYNTGSVSGAITGSGTNDVGGVVGNNADTLENSYNTGSVNGNNSVGGVAGCNQNTLATSYNTGNVSGTGAKIGGVVGIDVNLQSTLATSYNTGNVNGSNSVGGVVGGNFGTVEDSWNKGNVRGSYDIGGVVGKNFSTVEYSYNTGSISGTDFNLGGVVGENSGTGSTVETSWNTGSISSGSASYLGGVVGFNDCGTVESSWNTGNITGGSGSYIGGIVGENQGTGSTVESSWNTGNINGESGAYIGGIVGDNQGTGSTVETSYNTGSVSGTNDVGGVAGGNSNTGSTVETSYNTGSVIGTDNIGGVVGYNGGTVKTSYNTGSVSGSDSIGGIAGGNYDTVESSYNTGNVSGTNDVGGVVGGNFGTVQDAYYNHSLDTGAAIGAGTTTGTNVAGISTTNFGTSGSFAGMGTFNTFSSGAFTSSAAIAPWFIGTVYPNGGTTGISAPILVADLPVDTVTGSSGSSVYNGQSVATSYTQNLTLGGLPLLSGISATAGPNVGVYSVTPSVTLSTPLTQTSVGSYLVVPGTWTITKAPTSFSPGSGTSSGSGSLLFNIGGTEQAVPPPIFVFSETGAGFVSTVGAPPLSMDYGPDVLEESNLSR